MNGEPTDSDMWSELDGLPAFVQSEALSLSGQALAYVWGWQDAGGAPHDPNCAPRFADAYGVHVARYAKGLVSFRVSLQAAWTQWLAGQPIERRQG